MDHREIANEWFQYAKTDLEAAKFLKTMHPTPLEIICYHCQQRLRSILKDLSLSMVGKFKGHTISFH